MTAVTHDYPKLVGESFADMAELVASLDERQLDTPSLCDGWRVRDVAGHVASGVSTTLPRVLRNTAAKGFNVAKASKAGAIAWADSHSAADMATAIRDAGARYASGERWGLGRVLKAHDLVVDNLVHQQDIRRPLGLGAPIPPARLLAALDAAPQAAGPVGAKKRAKGLRLEATDVEWSWGSGPLVRGPGEAILLALTGRRACLGELTGDGVETLSRR